MATWDRLQIPKKLRALGRFIANVQENQTAYDVSQIGNVFEEYLKMYDDIIKAANDPHIENYAPRLKTEEVLVSSLGIRRQLQMIIDNATILQSYLEEQGLPEREKGIGNNPAVNSSGQGAPVEQTMPSCEAKPMDIAELRKLRPIVQAFVANVNESWNSLDDRQSHDRYHELYDMVEAASGDANFRKYVQPIQYWSIGGGQRTLWKEHATAILNSAVQLLEHLNSLIGNQDSEKSASDQIRHPVGSPFGFTEQSWKTVAERIGRKDVLYIVLGYQFESEYYDSNELRENVKIMFESAANRYNNKAGRPVVKVTFRALSAGYGEHLFNEIARDIISSDIAVFETSDLNSNVMIEMGVALTWGVQVLPIKLEGRPKPPSDISGQTWADYRDHGSRFVDSEHHNKLLGMIDRAFRKKQSG